MGSPTKSATACHIRPRTAARRKGWKSWPSAWPAQVEESDILTREDLFFGDEDGRFIAETLYGEASDENMEKVRYSNGMIVNFKRGEGEVFHAGTCEWVAGLLRNDAMVERVTANVLNRYLNR